MAQRTKKATGNGYARAAVSEAADGPGYAAGERTPWAALTQTWALEIAGFLTALACLAATVALLRIHDNELVPSWPITLNFILSLLGNVGFATTIFGVHAAVAQHKWVRYHARPRPLADLPLYQNVRSGPIGVFWLLSAAGGQFVILTGCVAILAGMFWGPFTQNLIRYESGTVTAVYGTALLARSIVFSSRGPGFNSKFYQQDQRFATNMLNALIAAPNEREVNLPEFMCSTGNCTWPPVATLAFCSRCTDISAQLVVVCEEWTQNRANDRVQQCTARLPGGTGVESVTANSRSEILMNTTITEDNTKVVMQSVRVLPRTLEERGTTEPGTTFRAPATISNFTATECTLDLCVMSIQPSVRQGVYSETVLDTFTEPAPDKVRWDRRHLRPPWGPERGIDPAANVSFGFSEDVAIDFYLTAGTGIFQNFAGEVSSTGQVETSGTQDIVMALFSANYTTPEACGRPNGDAFACAVRGMTDALTKTLRNSGVLANGTGAGDAYLARGRAETVATFVRVRWAWIVLPAAVWALGLAAWAVVAVQTYRMRLPKWRDDPLPLVFLYRDGDARGGQAIAGSPSAASSSTQQGGALLPAEGYSSWAYEAVFGPIHVQLQRPPEGHGGGDDGMMRLVRVER